MAPLAFPPNMTDKDAMDISPRHPFSSATASSLSSSGRHTKPSPLITADNAASSATAAATSSSPNSSRSISNYQSDRLPPMTLTDLPSPFALPTPTSREMMEGILGNPNNILNHPPTTREDSFTSSNSSSSTSTSTSTSSAAQTSDSKYAYRQPPQTPGTPMDNGRTDYTGNSPSTGRLRMTSPRTPGFGGGLVFPGGGGGGGGGGGSGFSGGSSANPWHHLAATSGIPTPAVEGSPFNLSLFAGPSSGLDSGASNLTRNVTPIAHPTTTTTTTTNTTPQGTRFAGKPISRGHSPHLGGPFEKLNLSGSSGGGGSSTSGTSIGGSQNPAVTPMMTTSDPFSTLPAASRRGSAGPSSGLNPNSSKEKITSPTTLSGFNSGFKLNFPAGLAATRSSKTTSVHGSSKTSGTTTPTSSSATGSSTPPASGSGSTGNSSVTDVLTTPAPMVITQLVALTAKTGVPAPLILDLRPPSAFARGRISTSISLPIPSTLLKRKTFTIQKLALMLPEKSMRMLTSFTSRTDVVIIDQDSVNAPMGGVLSGLASKLASAGGEWEGKIWFLKGGINACRDMEISEGSSEEGEEADTKMEPPLTLDVDMNSSASGETGEQSRASGASGASSAAARSSGVHSGEDRSAYSPPSSTRMAGGLGKLAFLQASTKGVSQRKLNMVQSTSAVTSTPAVDGVEQAPADTEAERSSQGARSGSGSAPTAIHGNGSSASKDSLRQVSDVKQYQPANPFFDNIRQNLELSHGGITERIPLNLPEDVVARSSELPPFLREMVEKPSEQVAEKLAGEFEAVERGEQRRLQGIMNWHSRGSRKLSGWHNQVEEDEEDEIMVSANAGAEQQVINRAASFRRKSSQTDPETWAAKGGSNNPEDLGATSSIPSSEEYFPFSITAGIERGSKNRYKNIWPYDYSRVRLNEKCHDDGSDYINANFVQPRGTTRRYIATQGPMDATYRDFWTLVWEQNVQVIVMLTKQFEGGAIKCGDYWTEGEYGPYKLQLISTEGGEDLMEKSVSGFTFFSANDPPLNDNPTIKRSFLLTKLDHPDTSARKITQMQCVSWPDFDVPSSPATLLSLVKEVDKAVASSAAEALTGDQQPPVLVHCSAGVGRTGSFIIVDAVLDALRREYLMKARKIRPQHRTSEQSTRSQGSSRKEPTSPLSRSPGNGISTFLVPNANNAPFTSPAQMELDEPDMNVAGGVANYGSYRDRTGSGDASETGDIHHTSSVGPTSPAADEKITHSDNFEFEMGRIPNIGDGKAKPHTPSPITTMPEPVKNILENMRIQRMSLCQSLRQYAFVYRSVIHGYLDMLDEETQAAEEAQAAHDDLHDAVRGNSNSSAGGVHFDEDGHIKRRASPTELSGASLTKRASFRKSSRGGSGVVTPHHNEV